MKNSIKFIAIALALSFFATTANAGDITTTATVTAKTVRYSENNKTINLAVGEEFLLKLGDKFTWSETVDNSGVLSRVKSVTDIDGAQAIYKAMSVGKATLSARGTEYCAAKKCQIFFFTVKINVTDGNKKTVNGKTGGVRSITSSSNGTIVDMKQGTVFRVKLYDKYDWTVMANNSYIAPVETFAAEKGVQGYFIAKKAGTTTITASGTPKCFDSTNYCELTKGTFKVRIRIVADESK